MYPIEVKSGKRYTTTSLNRFVEKYKSRIGERAGATISVMRLKIVECRRSGADITKVTISPSVFRRNADSSINGDQKMSMFR